MLADVATLQLEAKGRPNAQFAYLDSVDRLSKIFGPEVRQLRHLGTENYIFRPSFVVLMPGIKWYPVAGTATNEDSWGKRPKDFFTVELDVSVPQDWIVAGPARRELLPDEKPFTYRFDSLNPIPQLALVASSFERAFDSIEGIDFEVLYSSTHRRTFESLSSTGPAIRDRISRLLAEMGDFGLDYPYSVFSLVEVPASLRTYGDGSKLDTVLGMPGILMMSETTLPTLHLESLHNSADFARIHRSNWTDVDWMGLKIGRLSQYLGIELYAGNHLSHLYRSSFSDQTRAAGPRAEMLNLILEQVIQLILPEYEISFDFDLALDQKIQDLTYVEPMQIMNVWKNTSSIDRIEQLFNLREAREDKLTDDEVFSTVESIRLAAYGSHSDFETIENRALRLRALAVSKVLIDVIGADSLASVLTELLHRFRGKNFTYDEFIAVAQSQGVPIDKYVDDMLNSSQLPGFIASVLSQRLVETEEYSFFQATLLLENQEEVSGYCMLIPINQTADLHDYRYLRTRAGEPLFVDKNQSLEIVIESHSPIIDVVIEPYLSLNRNVLRLNVTSLQDLEQVARPFQGFPKVVSTREVQTLPIDEDKSIFVDDLDPGFSIAGPSTRGKFQPIAFFVRRLAGKSLPERIRGLPAFQFDNRDVPIDTWERKTDGTAYGRYWNTLVLNQNGRGATFAKFVTSLPSSGYWRLDYYLPEGNIVRVRRYQGRNSLTTMYLTKGLASIDVHVNSDVITQSIDTSAVKPGWQTLGEYAVENSNVEVWVSNNTRGRVVFADAIRWTPVDSPDSTSLESELNP